VATICPSALAYFSASVWPTADTLWYDLSISLVLDETGQGPFLGGVRGVRLINGCGLVSALMTATIVLWVSSSAMASDYEFGESYTGFKFGLVGSGRVELRRFDIDQRAGMSAGFFFDLPFGSRLHYSFAADLLKMSWRGQRNSFRWDESEWLLDLSVNLKGNLFSANSPIGLRPGLGVGVAILGKMETTGVAGSSYVTVKTFTELVFMSSSDLVGLIEGGVWYAPSGGDSNSDLTIGPLLMLRAGVMF